ncbi:HNH/endonuclease VII fold toxin-2 domain-containing protein [Chitinimonas lacunae]|uniref:HNH/endonuclease VII fold toxin-2 domain-containing protein n=1 Tax=Chitinimonas lacunae TaxID=1963018 RepID=A0ABV8MX90_9NEIS
MGTPSPKLPLPGRRKSPSPTPSPSATPTKPTQGKKSSPNTPTFPYIDSRADKQLCARDKQAIDDACKPEDDAAKKSRMDQAGNVKLGGEAQRRGVAGKLLSKLDMQKNRAPADGAASNDPSTAWITNHCEFLMIKPSSPEKLLGQLQGIPQKMAEELGVAALQTAKNRLQQELEDLIKKKVAAVLAKKAAGRLAIRALSVLTGPFAIAINVAVTAYDVYDAANSWEQIKNDFPDKVREIEDTARRLSEATAKIDEMKQALSQYASDPQRMVSDAMYAAAELNPCIRARRCSLVPFGNTHYHQPSKADCADIDEAQSHVQGPHNGKGCCPGQTGHHVLPAEMFSHCPNYKKQASKKIQKQVESPAGVGCVHQLAPSLCVEGVNNSHGSHGHVHSELGKVMGGMQKNGQSLPKGTEITKEQAIEAGATSIVEAFPESKCNKDCLKAQLRAFYTQLNCTPRKADGLPGGGGGSKETAPGTGGNKPR